MREGAAGERGDTEWFTTDVAVRYADVDTYGHVNNAVYATFCEEGRIDYFDRVRGQAGASIAGDADDGGADEGATVGTVVANLQLDFEQPIGRRDAVEVGVRVPRLGEKSFPIEYVVRSEAGVHATGETTMVAYDRDQKAAVRIPDRWRGPIAEFEGL
jgi:acyl-CoA thioester hydrolase